MADHIIKPNIGKVHTVEVHPDIDHLYRAKGLINDNKRPHLHVGDFKRHGFPDDIVKRLPRDGNGKVTPDMIDKHIASLPKHKLDITIHPYERGQQHRTYDANKEIINNEVSWKAPDQYVVSVNRHADTKFGPMSEKLHEISKKHQYKWGNDNNIGWGRIDPHKIDKNGNISTLIIGI